VGAFILSALLFFCWIAALATLLIFLESWFTAPRERFVVSRRASGSYGFVTVFFPLRGPPEQAERAIRAILSQSYPFIELFLIYSEDDYRQASLAREIRNTRTHVAVRLFATSLPLQTPDDRIRALEQAQPSAKGRWYVVVDSDVVLDRLAVETSLEFAGAGEVSALALRPGVQCRSYVQRFLAPSMEYLLRMIRVVERRRERVKKVTLDAAYLLVNREAFDVVNRINRMPGILNEAGWNIWSYQVEGLRTFEGDGSRWMWRQVRVGGPGYADGERRYTRRSASLVLASSVMSIIPVISLAYGFLAAVDSLLERSIFAFSAVSYALMSISYYLHARRLHAATWFAPLWFLAHAPAALLTLLDIRRAVRSSAVRRSEVIHRAGRV